MPEKQPDMDPEQYLKDLQSKSDTDDLDQNDSAISALNRLNLKKLAQHLGLTVKSSALKHVYFEEVVLALSERDLVTENLVESLSDVKSASGKEKIDSDFRLKELQLKHDQELKKIEAETMTQELQIQHDHELKIIDAEARTKLLNAETREKEADALLKEAHVKAILEGRTVSSHSDVSPTMD